MNANGAWSFEDEPGTTQRPPPNGHAPPEPALDPIVAIDWVALADRNPPERVFIVPGWLAPGHVTMLSAEGGGGKTTLAVQLCMSAALGRPWLGIETAHATAMMLAAEDDDDELHRKVVRYAGFMAVRKAELAGRLFLQGRVGMPNMLLAHPKGKPPEPLPLLGHIEEQAKAAGVRLIVIDNAAQFFAGEENARAEVTAFVNALAGIARRLQAAVLLLAHPPKNGADYSGSTAWHASVRCLWTLRRALEIDEDGADLSDVLVLCRVKSNYAKPGEEIRLRWVDGILRLADEPVSAMDVAFARQNAQATFLKALDELTTQGRSTSHDRRAGNYAPKLMVEAGLANMVDGLAGNIGRRDLERAMNDLLRDRRIAARANLWRNSKREWVTGIARSPAPGADE